MQSEVYSAFPTSDLQRVVSLHSAGKQPSVNRIAFVTKFVTKQNCKGI
ncbi:hypothetical protein H6F42_08120 [Pseudanabaena sp. FACHB-1998]|nr:hypothetical protein [Pseudanabaena sp. FACHB-1998]